LLVTKCRTTLGEVLGQTVLALWEVNARLRLRLRLRHHLHPPPSTLHPPPSTCHLSPPSPPPPSMAYLRPCCDCPSCGGPRAESRVRLPGSRRPARTRFSRACAWPCHSARARSWLGDFRGQVLGARRPQVRGAGDGRTAVSERAAAGPGALDRGLLLRAAGKRPAHDAAGSRAIQGDKFREERMFEPLHKSWPKGDEWDALRRKAPKQAAALERLRARNRRRRGNCSMRASRTPCCARWPRAAGCAPARGMCGAIRWRGRRCCAPNR